VLREQIPAVTEQLVKQFGPEFEKVRQAVSDFNDSLQKMNAEHQNLLESMKKQTSDSISTIQAGGGEMIKQWSQQLTGEELEKVVRGATQAWKVRLDEMATELENKARDHFREVSESAGVEYKSQITASVQETLGTFGNNLNALLEEMKEQWKSRMDKAVEAADGKWSRQLEATIERARQSWSSQLSTISGKADSMWTNLDQKVSNLRTGLAEFNDKIMASVEDVRQREESISALVWPDFYQTEPISPWRKRIENKLADRDPLAFALFLVVGRFNEAANSTERDIRKIAGALADVSTEAYRFWKSLECNQLEVAEQWRSAFQSFLDRRGIPLDIVPALEGERFDMNTMLCTEANGANRMYVKEPFSWVVRDRTGQTPRVLHHARVTTS
jgi:rubrerythrin